MKAFNAVLLSLLLWGCDGLEDTTNGEPVAIGIGELVCSTAFCTSASQTIQSEIKLSRVACEFTESSQPFDAILRLSIFCSGLECRSQGSSWSDADNNTVTELVSRSYYQCGWIDLNNDLLKSSGDAFSQELIILQDGVRLEASQWSQL